MPVRGNLLRRSCPCDNWGGVAEYVTCKDSVPILNTRHKTLWLRDEFWWYYKSKKRKKPRITGSMTGEGREEEMKYLLSTMGESDGYLY